jgi:hypothetical protein
MISRTAAPFRSAATPARHFRRSSANSVRIATLRIQERTASVSASRPRLHVTHAPVRRRSSNARAAPAASLTTTASRPSIATLHTQARVPPPRNRPRGIACPVLRTVTVLPRVFAPPRRIATRYSARCARPVRRRTTPGRARVSPADTASSGASPWSLPIAAATRTAAKDTLATCARPTPPARSVTRAARRSVNRFPRKPARWSWTAGRSNIAALTPAPGAAGAPACASPSPPAVRPWMRGRARPCQGAKPFTPALLAVMAAMMSRAASPVAVHASRWPASPEYLPTAKRRRGLHVVPPRIVPLATLASLPVMPPSASASLLRPHAGRGSLAPARQEALVRWWDAPMCAGPLRSRQTAAARASGVAPNTSACSRKVAP